MEETLKEFMDRYAGIQKEKEKLQGKVKELEVEETALILDAIAEMESLFDEEEHEEESDEEFIVYGEISEDKLEGIVKFLKVMGKFGMNEVEH